MCWVPVKSSSYCSVRNVSNDGVPCDNPSYGVLVCGRVTVQRMYRLTICTFD
jgi:hypothetical protein